MGLLLGLPIPIRSPNTLNVFRRPVLKTGTEVLFDRPIRSPTCFLVPRAAPFFPTMPATCFLAAAPFLTLAFAPFFPPVALLPFDRWDCLRPFFVAMTNLLLPNQEN